MRLKGRLDRAGHQVGDGVVVVGVDDTLHHTDPGGTDWNLDTITHLRPLLHAARNAGRTESGAAAGDSSR